MPSIDRYAELRRDLAVFRLMTAHYERFGDQPWCRDCQSHLADDSGLCPVCAPAQAA